MGIGVTRVARNRTTPTRAYWSTSGSLGGVNWSNLLGDGRLFDGALPLRNAGYAMFSWGLEPTSSSGAVQATCAPGTNGAIIATAFGPGVDEYWFIGVLGRGLSKLDPHLKAP